MRNRARLIGSGVLATAAIAAGVSLGASPAAANHPHEGCPAPGNVSSYHVYGLGQHGIGCDHARHLLIENLAHHRYHTYTCNHSLRGTRDVHMHCTDTGNSAHQYSASYRVH